jgi:hypothetical protein
MSALSFDEGRHIYRYGEAVVPSVTQILDCVPPRLGMLDLAKRTNPAAVERKRQIGQATHAAAHYYDEGTLDWSTVDPQAEPYLAGWCKFREDTGFRPSCLETRVYHPAFGYAGTLDRLGAFENADLALIDIKTGDITAADLQLAAYDAAFRAMHDMPLPLPRYVVQLLGDGRYKLHPPYTNRRDFRVFQACLELANYLLRLRGLRA